MVSSGFRTTRRMINRYVERDLLPDRHWSRTLLAATGRQHPQLKVDGRRGGLGGGVKCWSRWESARVLDEK